jgi:TRAP transporter TAXI family solute receptor
VLGLAVLLFGAALAQEITFFRIGTGSTAGTYFPIGGVIAGAISSPPGARPCDKGGSCGVPGLIAAAQSMDGSVANVAAIAAGTLESGLSQADVAFWAHVGSGIYQEQGAVPNLRAIANLYPESVQLVVRQDAFITNVSELAGRRISVDREGSGTRVDALLILEAYGLSPEDLELHAVEAPTAVDMLRRGELDGFFLVAGTPTKAVTELAQEALISLVPITGPEADGLRERYSFFATDVIPSATYFNVPVTHTLSVGAQWLVGAEQPEELVYGITKALWHDTTRRLLDQGHPMGRLIRLETALDGLGVPLHPGAARYYREAGLLSAEGPGP